ncbi:xanthine dehydrogenase family protein molybdopterin-binding subunit [Fodinicurvata sp. EGI_FJ10296]|uniref:xanthine dehydrogenase family protein molybdopterin-binding subunit n=1 Tax=Fodinicurvata sp. EGI_FJ10296 TaxID=3231908 RepID=UPI003451170B
MAPDGIGTALRRKEDKRFITGNGHYTDDLNRQGQAHAYFLRSPLAHARIRSIKTADAEKADGVVAVFTGKDVQAAGLGGLICGWMVKSKDGSDMKAGAHPALAVDRVRYVGDHVAVVIAETLDQAKDAADLIDVDYEELAPIVATADADAPDAPRVHDEAPDNVCFDWEIGDKAATDGAFEKASHVTRMSLINNRLIPNAIEPRAAVGEFDPGTDSYTLYTTSQNPHVARLVLSAFVGIAPEHKLRVVAPDVGGGFGSKIFIYAEETICVWAAAKVKRPVKWTAERGESFLSDAHGRDHVTEAEMALDADGRILGLRVHTKANLGAYLSTFASAVPTYLYGTLLSGQYAIPAIHCEVRGLYTNTAPVDAYRGAGRPEATYVVERMCERAARDLKMDPAEFRRKNFIQPDAYPYQTPVIMTYDCGDYPRGLQKALENADYANFAKRRSESEARGKLRGVGFSSYIEACGIAPSAAVGSLGAGVGLWESAKIRFNPTGNVTVYTGAHSHGQGHETSFAQLISSYLGVDPANVEVSHGDTAQTPFGMGTYGSRSLAVGGSAIFKAAEKVIEKGKKIAAHLMEASEGDIEFKDGKFTVAGTDNSKTIQEIAFSAYVPHNYPADLEPGLEESAFYDPINFTFPAGTQICEVEIDPDTGVTEIVNFVAVDDFGVIINPMIVEGQVHGGIAQGVGQALLENCVYDTATGQLLTGSYMDYCMPRADNLPSFNIGMIETRNPSNPLGVKGCGEAGAIAAPAAVMNAVTDAIGMEIQMPASPERVWRAIQQNRQAVAAE